MKKQVIKPSNLKQQQEAIFALSGKYIKSRKKEKSEILNFLVQHFSLQRDDLARMLRVMGRAKSPSSKLSFRGRKPVYCHLCIWGAWELRR